MRRIGQLIDELKALREEHGNLPVVTSDIDGTTCSVYHPYVDSCGFLTFVPYESGKHRGRGTYQQQPEQNVVVIRDA